MCRRIIADNSPCSSLCQPAGKAERAAQSAWRTVFQRQLLVVIDPLLVVAQVERGCGGLSYAGGAFSKASSPSAKVIQGCLLRVQICRVGRSQDVSSSVPARTRATPSLGGLATQDPHSGQTPRVLVRPLSAKRWRGRGSTPLRRKLASGTTIPKLNALLVKRWQSRQWHA